MIQERLTTSDPSIRGELSKAVHNRADFELKVKPKIYLLLGKNGNVPRFDYLNPDHRTVLVDLLILTYRNLTTTTQGRMELKK